MTSIFVRLKMHNVINHKRRFNRLSVLIMWQILHVTMPEKWLQLLHASEIDQFHARPKKCCGVWLRLWNIRLLFGSLKVYGICVQKFIKPEAIIAMGAQSVPNFLIMRTERWNTIHRLSADVWMGPMSCIIAENHTILHRHIDHKSYYEAKTNG